MKADCSRSVVCVRRSFKLTTPTFFLIAFRRQHFVRLQVVAMLDCGSRLCELSIQHPKSCKNRSCTNVRVFPSVARPPPNRLSSPRTDKKLSRSVPWQGDTETHRDLRRVLLGVSVDRTRCCRITHSLAAIAPYERTDFIHPSPSLPHTVYPPPSLS